MGAITHLSDLDTILEDLLTQIPIHGATYGATGATGLVLLDRIDELVHLGVRVDYPSTQDQELSPGSAASGVWADDEVEVHLLYDLTRVQGQREGRRLAWDLETLIRLAVTGSPLLAASHPRYQGTIRTIPRPGWYQVVQTFLVHRDVGVR